MGTKGTSETLQKALGELEQVAEEIRLKLHLASMDAKKEWDEKIEPKLFEARERARTVEHSESTVVETIRKLRAFAASL